MTGLCEAVVGIVCVMGSPGITITQTDGLHQGIVVEGDSFSAEIVRSDARAQLDYGLMQGACAFTCAYYWRRGDVQSSDYYADGGPDSEPVYIRVSADPQGQREFESHVALRPQGGFFRLDQLPYHSTPALPVMQRIRAR